MEHKKSPLMAIFFLTSLLFFLLILYPLSPNTIDKTLISTLRNSFPFLLLKNLHFSWFMSSINDNFRSNNSSNGKLLCLLPNASTKNFYAVSYKETLPRGAILLPGLTYISDTQYDYTNPFHGLSTLVPVVGWYMKKGCEAPPSRWVLFTNDPFQTEISSWIKSIVEATIGTLKIENFSKIEGPVCFEEAIVLNKNQSEMKMENLREVYDRIRCMARRKCKVEMKRVNHGDGEVKITVLLRSGTRLFKNETGFVKGFEEACANVRNCRVTAARFDNLTFCEQVKLLSETDILAGPHGAEMANMILLEENTSIMEFHPIGWAEMTGEEEEDAFFRLAKFAGMRHQGAWREPNLAFNIRSDGRIRYDQTYFVKWASDALREAVVHRRNLGFVGLPKMDSCSCGYQ